MCGVVLRGEWKGVEQGTGRQIVRRRRPNTSKKCNINQKPRERVWDAPSEWHSALT